MEMQEHRRKRGRTHHAARAWGIAGLLTLGLVVSGCTDDDGERRIGDVATDVESDGMTGDASEDAEGADTSPDTDGGAARDIITGDGTTDTVTDTAADAVEHDVAVDTADTTSDADADVPPTDASDTSHDADGGDVREDPDAGPEDAPDTADVTSDPDADVDPRCPAEEELWDDVAAQIDDWTPAPRLEELSYGDVTPAESVDYLELRLIGFDDSSILGSAGEICAGASDRDACESAFAELSTDRGFAPGCMPAYCAHALAYTRGDEVGLINDADAFVEFLGSIDNGTEALLVALARAYGWNARDRTVGSWRETDSGFELLVTDLVSGCDPIVQDRVQLYVSSGGAAEVIRRQHWSVLCGACF